jgi:hypothetical protein
MPALSYVLLFQALGWYVYVGRRGHAFVWVTVPRKMPLLLRRWWQGPPNVYGHSIGNVVVISDSENNEFFNYVLAHEQVHVQQAMRLGIWMPLFYCIFYLTCLALDNVDSYRDNPLEIDARLGSNQKR